MRKIFTIMVAAFAAIAMNAEPITVAEALEAGSTLQDGELTEQEYEIAGYVTAYAGKDAATDGGWSTYKNQIFWIADEKGDAASNEAGALEVYQGVASEMIYVGDKIIVKSKIKNYKGLLETEAKSPVTIVEKADRPSEPPVEEDDADVTFLPADFEGQGQAATLETPGGTVSTEKDGVTVATDNGYGHGMALRVYKGGKFTVTSSEKQIGKIKFQFYSTYDGGLDNEVVVNGMEYEVASMASQARIEKIQVYFGEAEEQELEPITVAQALKIAQALQPEKGKSAFTPEKYAVKGHIVGTSSKYENTWYLADELGAYGEFEAFKCSSVDYEVTEGDLVIVTGKIQHYYGEGSNGEYHSYEISGGTLVHVYAQGIENVTLTEKVQKVVVDGAIYIVRDGKMFNLQGAQVR